MGDHHYRAQFYVLCDEYRTLKEGKKGIGINLKSMAHRREPPESSEFWRTLEPLQDRDKGVDPSMGSLSRPGNAFESNSSSDSTAESEKTSGSPQNNNTESACGSQGRLFYSGGCVASEISESQTGETISAHNSRKGHKKSRQGCFNCKKRKIKCQETQPACINCKQKGLECTYPAPTTLKALQVSLSYSSSPIEAVSLQSTPTAFSLTDMRLFHHFLLVAYPHLPVGNDSAWISQVPLIAHHNEYLMHAILGMAASHLELLTGASLGPLAIHHRVQAIRGSNKALLQKNRMGADGDALLAACYLLTFQSSYMPDGLEEFFTMVRGCSVLSNQLRMENLPMAFFLTEKDHFQFMEQRLLNLPTINWELVEGAEKSLAALPYLCERQSQKLFYELLDACVDAIKLSSLRAYFKFVSVFQGIIQMDNELFQDFIDPKNLVARVLISHFLAIQLVMAPIINREWSGRNTSSPVRNHFNQIYSSLQIVPDEMKHYLKWPVAIADAATEEISGRQNLVPKIPILTQVNWART